MLDVHRPPAGEVEQPLESLRRAAALVRAPPVGLALVADERRAARGAGRRERPLPALFCRFASTGPTTSGITSPARRTITVSPSRTSLRRTSSSLCSVAYVTVTPPTEHGLEHRERRDDAGPAGVDVDRLQQRRALLRRELVRDGPPGGVRVAPSSSCWAMESTLPPRRRSRSRWCGGRVSHRSMYANTSARSSTRSRWAGPAARPRAGTRGSPCATRTACPRRSRTRAPQASGREAVTFGSFCRSEPAAALRGLANVRCPASSRPRSAARTPSPAGTSRRGPRGPAGGPSCGAAAGCRGWSGCSR